MRSVLYAPARAVAFIGVSVVALSIGAPSSSAQQPILQPVNPELLVPIETGGFGDPGNTRSVVAWFKGDLYVATERWTHCVVAAALEERTRLPVYPPPTEDCPPDAQDLALSAEIWRYSPATGQPELVFSSPETVPVDPAETVFVARDVAFTAMEVVTESDGTEALYVGGQTYAGAFGQPSPLPPRLLRTVDGTSWAPVPQDPGTFLGELGQPFPGSALVARRFKELIDLDGTLVALLSTAAGAGMLIASDEPASGGDAWFPLTGAPEEFPVSAAAPFNGQLYVGVGAPGSREGYSIQRTADLFSFVPVVVNELSEFPGSQPVRAMSFAEHRGKLYAGTAWPPELIRIDEDDSWELLIGAPRPAVDGGADAPLSGIPSGFGNVFNSQIGELASDGTNLYLGTLDGSILTQLFPEIGSELLHEVGFDLFRSEEGIYWHPVSKIGLGVPTQYGVSDLDATPAGLVVATLGIGGTQLWLGGSPSPPPVAAPFRVEAASSVLTEGDVVLSWEPDPDADVYLVYRSEVTPIFGGSPVPVPGEGGSFICDSAPELCLGLQLLGERLGLPGPFVWIDTTTEPFFVESPPTSLQSMYFVRTMRADGQLSRPSNVVGAASTAPPVTFSALESDVLERLANDEMGLSALRALTMVRRAAHSARGDNLPAARRMLELGEIILERERGQAMGDEEADELGLAFYRLRRNLQLAEWMLVPLGSLL